MVAATGAASQRPKLLQAVLDAFRVPDLRARILFTLALLIVFRFVATIPIPGVDAAALARLFEQNQLIGFLNLFSGGALSNMSVAAMGVYPYITASIVIQLLTPVFPNLRRMAQEDGESGRQRLNQITHWLTVPVGLLQGYGQLLLLQQAGVVGGVSLFGPNALATISALLTMLAGTMFLVWLGELITERGIGNGISLIIFGGIVANMPSMLQQARNEGDLVGVGTVAVLGLGIIALIVFFNEATRRIPVQYGRSVFRGGRMYRQTSATYLPLRVNSAGMIPLIFAFSVVILPGIIAQMLAASQGAVGNVASRLQGLLDPSGTSAWLYWGLSFVLVVAFTFFYTIVVFQQQNLAENLQKNGGFIPGIRPGKPTADYLNRIIMRITWGGALFLGFVAVLPFLGSLVTDVQTVQLSGASLLILVGVALDTMRQLEAQLLMRQYEGFLR